MKFIDLLNEDDYSKQEARAKVIYRALKNGVIYTNIHYELPDDYQFGYLGGQYHITVPQQGIRFYTIKRGKKEYMSITHDYMFMDLFIPIRNKFQSFNFMLYRKDIPMQPKHLQEDESKEQSDKLKKRAKTLFTGLKKGEVTIDVTYMQTGNYNHTGQYTFKYSLGDLYIYEDVDKSIRTPKSGRPFSTNYNIPSLLIPEITIHCEEAPELDNNNALKLQIFRLIRDKFKSFGLELKLKPLSFNKKNDKWHIINESTDDYIEYAERYSKFENKAKKIYRALKTGMANNGNDLTYKKPTYYILPDEYNFYLSPNFFRPIITIHDTDVEYFTKDDNGEPVKVKDMGLFDSVFNFQEIANKFALYKFDLQRHG